MLNICADIENKLKIYIFWGFICGLAAPVKYFCFYFQIFKGFNFNFKRNSFQQHSDRFLQEAVNKGLNMAVFWISTYFFLQQSEVKFCFGASDHRAWRATRSKEHVNYHHSTFRPVCTLWNTSTPVRRRGGWGTESDSTADLVSLTRSHAAAAATAAAAAAATRRQRL